MTLCICLECGPPWRNDRTKPDQNAPWFDRINWASWEAICPNCGDKRCPAATNHNNHCQT